MVTDCVPVAPESALAKFGRAYLQKGLPSGEVFLWPPQSMKPPTPGVLNVFGVMDPSGHLVKSVEPFSE